MTGARRSRASGPLARAVVLGLTLAPGVVAQAQTTDPRSPAAVSAPTSAPVPAPAPVPQLTGDWGGIRSRLVDQGVTITPGFTSESAAGLGGGRISGGAAFAYELNLRADFDLDKLAGWKGGKFHISVLHRDGQSLSGNRIDNIFQVQEIYSTPRGLRLFNFAFEQSFSDDRVNIAFGRLAESSDFANSIYFCEFQTISVCGVPFAIALNDGFSYSPLSSWGARVRLKMAHGWQIQAGAYEANPKLPDRSGFDFSTSGATGITMPVEIAYKSARASYKVALFYDTSNRPDLLSDEAGRPFALSGAQPRSHSGRFNGYAMAEQTIVGTGKPGTRAVVLIAGITVSDRRTSFMQDFEYAGVVIKGPLASRLNDAINVIFARGGVSADLRRSQRLAPPGPVPPQSAEAIFEFNYKFAVLPSLAVTPNLQLVRRPGAGGDIPNATVLGLRIAATL